jgi:hypothetical protein
MMTTIAIVAAALLVSMAGSSSGQIVPRAVACLHDGSENAANRTLREQALLVARAINTAEGQAVQRSGRFQTLATLSDIPAVPDGFTLRLYADADGYVFSLKDTRDLCRFGIFSDQSGTVYPSTPTVPQMARR